MEIVKVTSGDAIVSSSTLARTAPTPVQLELEDLYLILQIEPYDTVIALELARQLCRRDRANEALRVLRSVVNVDSRFETLSALGQVEYELDLNDDAFNHLQQALMVGEGESSALFGVFKTLGNIFVKRGDFESAEDAYYKAHRIQPDSDVLHVNLGTLAIQRGRWDEALGGFRRALELNSQSDKAWTGLAIAHRMKGDRELAWGNLEAALQHNPLNETALKLALDWAQADGHEGRTLELLRNFLVGGGWSERLSLAFAWLSFKRGDVFPARLEVERLLAVNPDHGPARHLAYEMTKGVGAA